MQSFNKTLSTILLALFLLLRPSSASYMRGKASTNTDDNKETTSPTLRGLKIHGRHNISHNRTTTGLLTDGSGHSFDITFYTSTFDYRTGLSAWGTQTRFYSQYNGTGTDGLSDELGTALLSVVDYNYVEGENTTDYLNDNTIKFVFDKGDMVIVEGLYSAELSESDFLFAITGGTNHFVGARGQASIEVDEEEILTWKFYFSH